MSRIETKITIGALAITYFAQLGSHAEIHHQIANLAMAVELGTLGAIRLRMNRLVAVGLLVIGGCFAAVPATDRQTINYFEGGGRWQDFPSQVLWPDFVNHINNFRK